MNKVNYISHITEEECETKCPFGHKVEGCEVYVASAGCKCCEHCIKITDDFVICKHK